MPDPDDFLSVTGSFVDPSLTFSERDELEHLRNLFGSMQLGSSGGVMHGSGVVVHNPSGVSHGSGGVLHESGGVLHGSGGV